jgi:AraC-like DNA-binding protein
MRRLEGPGRDAVLILTFGNEWLIDGVRRESFIGGLRMSPVRTEHAGWSSGMHIGIAPWAAHALLGVPMHELAGTSIALDDVLHSQLVGRVQGCGQWDHRFELLDDFFARAFASAKPVSREVVWAWKRLCGAQGDVRVGALVDELGWSRKRLGAHFREQIGLTPKATARLLRFERARELAGRMSWAEIAFACGYADQSHLVSEFRAFSGRTPETFLQDS